MKQIWKIYKNGNNVGQCDRLSQTFKHIETLAGRKLSNYDMTQGKIRVCDSLDVYEARKESLNA